MNKQNKQELQVHVGETIEDMGRRFVDAWHRAERGALRQAPRKKIEGWWCGTKLVRSALRLATVTTRPVRVATRPVLTGSMMCKPLR